MSKAKYAIFLPVHNGARYVCEAVDSIIAQTSDDWVLAVLDNASMDKTVELVSAYRHPNIHIHRSSGYLSIWDSWHRVWGLLSSAAVEAEFVTFIGHDDRLLPDFLKTIDLLTAGHPTAGLYQTAYNIIDAKGNMIRPCRPIPPVESSADFLKARFWGLRDSCGTGYVCRSADYVAVGGIPKLPQLLFADDLLFARLANSQGKVASSTIQFEYRLHRGSASNAITRGRICAYVGAIGAYVDMIQDEFPEFAEGRTGSAALACLLAREIMVMRPLAIGPLMPASTRGVIRKLVALYHSVAGGVDYRQWLGANLVSRDVYVRAKQMMLLSVLVRDQLLRRS